MATSLGKRAGRQPADCSRKRKRRGRPRRFRLCL